MYPPADGVARGFARRDVPIRRSTQYAIASSLAQHGGHLLTPILQRSDGTPKIPSDLVKTVRDVQPQ